MGVFKSQIQFHCLQLLCSYLQFLSCSVLGDCTFLRNCLFLLSCWSYWLIVAYGPMYFCNVRFNFFFISNCIDLGSLTFFSCVWLKFYWFCLSFLCFFLWLHLSIWKFLGQGSNQSCSCQPTPQPQQHGLRATSETYTTVCANDGSLNHWARLGIEPIPANTISGS